MNLHNRIIHYLKENPDILGSHIGLFDLQVSSDVSLSSYGDIDLLIRGMNYDLEEVDAIVEIKGHRGLVAHYVSHQLPKYIKFMPKAKQFVGYLKDGIDEVTCENLEFLEYSR